MGKERNPVVKSESLRASEEEKLATSSSLYGDHTARISSNTASLRDAARLGPYIKAIQTGFKSKTVLHLGCGYGLLSMLAAGVAKHVYAVDTSAIVDAASTVAEHNKITNITFSRYETIEKLKLPVEKVDVILCEWFGCFLTNEDQLRSLLIAKERFLADGGVVCPNESTLFVAGISDYNYVMQTSDWWDNVYGFNMQAMKPLVTHEAVHSAVPRHCFATRPVPIHTFNIDEHKGGYKSDDLSYTTKTFQLKADANQTIHFLSFYFDGSFSNPSVNPSSHFTVTCSPFARNPQSQWTQVSVFLKESIPVNKGDVIEGVLSVTIPRDRDDDERAKTAAASSSGSKCGLRLNLKCSNGIVRIEEDATYHFVY